MYKGGKRKKHRTHKEPNPTAKDGTPSALIVRRGKVVRTAVQLVKDLRRLMLPNTAPRLKERRANSLRDFVAIAGQFHLTHVLLLSQTGANVNLRVTRMPQGPTLTFRVKSYTLARQVKASQKTPVEIVAAYEHAPLLVLHGFASAGSAAPPSGAGISQADALKMTMITLQAMFPSLDPATVKLADCRRVVLVHYDKETGLLELRHYIIRAAPVGLSRAMKKVVTGRKIPDLGGLKDISEFITGVAAAAVTSDSEFEDDAAKVTLPSDYAGKGNMASRQSAVKLTEIGPRMSLQLMKIEEGVCEGEVLYHSLVTKTRAQVEALRKAAAERIRLKAIRKAQQEGNVKRKQAAEDAKKAEKAARKQAKQDAALTAAAAGKLGDDDDDEGEEEADEGDAALDEDVDGAAVPAEEEDNDDAMDEDDDDEEDMHAAGDDFEVEGEDGDDADAADTAAADADDHDEDDDDEDDDDDGEDAEDAPAAAPVALQPKEVRAGKRDRGVRFAEVEAKPRREDAGAARGSARGRGAARGGARGGRGGARGGRGGARGGMRGGMRGGRGAAGGRRR